MKKSTSVPTLPTHINNQVAYYVVDDLEQLSRSMHSMKPSERSNVEVTPWALEFEAPGRGLLLSQMQYGYDHRTVRVFRREQVATAREAEGMLEAWLAEDIQENDLVAFGYNGVWRAMGVVLESKRKLLKVMLTDIDPECRAQSPGDVVKVYRANALLLSRAAGE